MVRARPYGLAKGLMVPCEAHHLMTMSFVARPVVNKAASEATKRKGAQAPFLFAYTMPARLNTALAGSYGTLD